MNHLTKRGCLAAWLLLALAGQGHAQAAGVLSVCEVLDHLSELSGKEVYVRGFWISTDVGEMIVPLNPCPRPVIRDGWSWRHLVAIPPSKNLPADPHRLALVSIQRALAERHESEAMVVATFVGRIETSSHFKIRTSASPKKPIGYNGGDCVAEMDSPEVLDIRSERPSPEFGQWWRQVAIHPEAVRSKP